MRRNNLWKVGIALGMALATCMPTGAIAQRIIPGQVAQQRVEKLTAQIQWHESLPDALAEARREGKLVFWVHMLGQIDGAT